MRAPSLGPVKTLGVIDRGLDTSVPDIQEELCDGQLVFPQYLIVY